MEKSAGWTRRRVLAAGAGLALPLGACSTKFSAPERGPFAVLFAGKVDDGGFNSLVLEAVTRVEVARGVPVQVSTVAGPDFNPLADALRSMARSDARMVFGVGPTLAAPIQRVAWEFPASQFTLLHGHLVRPNLAAYLLREEELAWLAGFLAARLSKSGTLGVLSDTAEDLRRRIGDAFRAGAQRAKAGVSVLTANDERDPAPGVRMLARQHADVVYGALDAAPSDAIEKCRAAGVKFIGRLRDWSDSATDTVVASCVMDPGALFATAAQDIIDSVWRGDYVRSFGLRYPEMLAFAVSDRVPSAVAAEVRSIALDVMSGRVALAPSQP